MTVDLKQNFRRSGKNDYNSDFTFKEVIEEYL